MDDCSSDSSKTIIEKYRTHPKVKILYNTQNSGNVFRQWEKGLANTTGEYIWIAESDDYSDLTFLEKMVSMLDKYTSAGIAFCASYGVDEKGTILFPMQRTLSEEKHAKEVADSIYLIDGKKECETILATRCTIPNISCSVFRRKAVSNIQMSYDYRLCGDWVFYINIALHYDFVYRHEMLNYFRHATSSVRNQTVKAGTFYLEKLRIYFYLKRFIHYNSETRIKYIDEYTYFLFFYLLRKEIQLKPVQVLGILRDLQKIYIGAFLIVIKNLLLLFIRAGKKIIKK